MDVTRLNDISTMIQKVSEVLPPFNYNFYEDKLERNPFARTVRGELPQRRIWEDNQNIVFLTPFANTPGFTVLVPRTHLLVTSSLLKKILFPIS
jgi:hypothetical protein